MVLSLYSVTGNDDMGLEIGALMALSSMPFTKGSPDKGRIVQVLFSLFNTVWKKACFLAKITSRYYGVGWKAVKFLFSL